jgi:hypothetical protein
MHRKDAEEDMDTSMTINVVILSRPIEMGRKMMIELTSNCGNHAAGNTWSVGMLVRFNYQLFCHDE